MPRSSTAFAKHHPPTSGSVGLIARVLDDPAPQPARLRNKQVLIRDGVLVDYLLARANPCLPPKLAQSGASKLFRCLQVTQPTADAAIDGSAMIYAAMVATHQLGQPRPSKLIKQASTSAHCDAEARLDRIWNICGLAKTPEYALGVISEFEATYLAMASVYGLLCKNESFFHEDSRRPGFVKLRDSFLPFLSERGIDKIRRQIAEQVRAKPKLGKIGSLVPSLGHVPILHRELVCACFKQDKDLGVASPPNPVSVVHSDLYTEVLVPLRELLANSGVFATGSADGSPLAIGLGLPDGSLDSLSPALQRTFADELRVNHALFHLSEIALAQEYCIAATLFALTGAYAFLHELSEIREGSRRLGGSAELINTVSSVMRDCERVTDLDVLKAAQHDPNFLLPRVPPKLADDALSFSIATGDVNWRRHADSHSRYDQHTPANPY